MDEHEANKKVAIGTIKDRSVFLILIKFIFFHAAG
jgi:hypothetical protein